MSIRLIAVRHANPLNEGFADETLRPISAEGREIQARIGSMMKEELLIPDTIFTSPLLRARQTAEVLGDIFQVPVEDEPSLGYVFNEIKLLKLISSVKNGCTIMLVGHEPTLASFVNRLVKGEPPLPRGLPRSGAIVISFESEVGFGRGSFLTFLNPHTLL